MEESSHFCGVCGTRLAAPAVPAVSLRDAAADFEVHDSVDGASTVAGTRTSRELQQAAVEAGLSAQMAAVDRDQPSDGMFGNGLFDANEPYVGQALNNRFVIECKLGEGGFGAVYKGVQKGTNRIVAIKLLHPEMTRDRNVVERFRREGQVLCSLRDEHTVTTYDFDQTEDGTLFIAMELLEGRSLHDVFGSEAPIRWQRMLTILSEMCTSLAEAHAIGVVHRDLKPENVHLEKRAGNDEFVKILDFGIAKMLRGEGIGGTNSPQLTATGQTLGTLEYMSPEQLMGKQLDGRSDVYGMGVLAYELMTARLPFPDAIGPAMLISAQLKRVPEVPSVAHPAGGIPPEVDALILKMLSKNRADRFADVSALRQECLRILGSQSPAREAPAQIPVSKVERSVGQPQHGDGPQMAALQQSRVATTPGLQGPGPSTQAIIAATAQGSKWLWVVVFGVLALCGAVALTLSQ